MDVLGRYRNLTILVGVLFLQLLGLAVQVKRSADADTRLIRIWAVDSIIPFERGLLWIHNGGGNLWHNYFYLRGVRAENRELKEQIEQMRLAQVRMSEDATQAHRLQALMAFKEQYIAKTVPAQIIGSCGSDLSRCIYIDKGSNEGIDRDMAVISAGGIVGKVLHAYPSTSQVLMINDQSSGVGALLEKSRLQGVLRGTPDGELILERVMSDETVLPGETVLSSGGDQIFPKGLAVGTVSQVTPGKELFLNIHVKPAADLSRVEEVLVVTQKQEREPVVAAAGPRVRAADILAQRLPSVPEKPATPVATAESSGAIVAHTTTVSGQAVSSDVLKQAVQKPASSPTGGDVNSGKTAPARTASADAASGQARTSNASPNASPSAASSATSSPNHAASAPAKPGAGNGKPSSAQSTPQPNTTEDVPH
jgi:rod shape-determining protein MreC